MAIEPAPETRLATLAADINREHAACATALQTTLQHAIRAGELLAEAKALLPHGGWLPWLEANFQGSVRSAQAYMRVAARRAELAANTQDAAHLTLSTALEQLATPSAAAADTPAAPAEEPDEVQRLIAQMPEVEAEGDRLASRMADLERHAEAWAADPNAQTLAATVALWKEAQALQQDATVYTLRTGRALGVLLNAAQARAQTAQEPAAQPDEPPPLTSCEEIAAWLRLPGRLTPTGWELPENLTFEEWQAAGQRLMAVSHAFIGNEPRKK
jgi:hypothetical protein